MNYTSIHEISPPPLTRSRRNDMKKNSRRNDVEKSRHPGKCEAFIRDPGNALALHVDSPGFRTLLRNGATIPE